MSFCSLGRLRIPSPLRDLKAFEELLIQVRPMQLSEMREGAECVPSLGAVGARLGELGRLAFVFALRSFTSIATYPTSV